MPKNRGEWVVLLVLVAVAFGVTAVCILAAYGASIRFDWPWL